MKAVSVIITCLLLTICINGQVWEPDMRLTNNTAESHTSNTWCIAVSGNNIHVVWHDLRDGNYEIYYKRSLDNGKAWRPDQRLTNDPAPSGYPSVAVSGDNIHVVWEDYRDGNWEIYYKCSTDNGETWTTDMRLTNETSGSEYPSVTVSGDNIHVVWQDNRDENKEIYYKRSTDNGETWGIDKRLTNENHNSEYPSVAASEDNIHLAWQDEREENREIYYKRSPDNGQTWTADQRFTSNRRNSEYPSVAASGDNIHLLWQERDGYDGNTGIYYRRSIDNGAIWEDAQRLTKEDQDSKCPSIAVFGNNIHGVWQDHRDENPEIYHKRSIDNGATWTEDQRLTDDPAESYAPSVAVCGNNIHVVWYDDRDGNEEIYYKRGGEPFQPDNQIKDSDESSYTGDNIYNLDGTDQTKKQGVDPEANGVYHIKIENDGFMTDNINVTGIGDAPGWTVKYYDALTGGTDITTDVTGTGWATGPLTSGDYKEIRAEITPDSSVPDDSSYKVLITSTSRNDAMKRDAVKAIITVPAGIEETSVKIPEDYSLYILPNPSGNRTIIKYGLSEENEISLLVYDIKGSIVKILIRAQKQEPGAYTVAWDGCSQRGISLPNGIYFCQLKAAGFLITKKLTLLQ